MYVVSMAFYMHILINETLQEGQKYILKHINTQIHRHWNEIMYKTWQYAAVRPSSKTKWNCEWACEKTA